MAVLFRRRRQLRYLLAFCFFSQIEETTEEREKERDSDFDEMKCRDIRVLPKKEMDIWAC